MEVHEIPWAQVTDCLSTVLVCPDIKLVPTLTQLVTSCWKEQEESDWYIFAPLKMQKDLRRDKRCLFPIEKLSEWNGPDLLRRQGFDMPVGKVRFIPQDLFGREKGLPPRCLYLHVNKFLLTPPTKLVIVLPGEKKSDLKLRWLTRAVTQNMPSRRLQVLLVVTDPNVLPKSIYRGSQLLLVTGNNPPSDLYKQAQLSRVVQDKKHWQALVDSAMQHPNKLLLALFRNDEHRGSIHYINL